MTWHASNAGLSDELDLLRTFEFRYLTFNSKGHLFQTETIITMCLSTVIAKLESHPIS
jgi:hypothetical protein